MEAELREATYTSLSARLRNWVKPAAFENSAWNMYSGNMWDAGRGYIGPIPALDDSDRDRVLNLITRAFTSRNVVKETVDRAINGLISRSPNWKVYNQAELISRAIQEAQKRADNARRMNSADASVTQIANAKDGNLPKKEADAQNALALSATANEGNINITARNDQGSQDQPEIVNKKEIEAEIILGKLWTDLNLKEVLRKVLAERLVAKRGCARVYVPKKYIADDGSIKNVNGFLDAIKAVGVEHVARENAKVIESEGDRISVVKIEKSGKNESKIVSLKGIEISFVDDSDGKTYLAVFEPANQKKKSSKNDQPPAELNQEDTNVSEVIKDLQKNADLSDGFFLDGNLLAEEISGDPFVTEQLLQNNRALNLDLTLGVNVLVEDGFTEMITTNAALQYAEVPDPDDPTKKIKVARKLQRGSSMTTNLVGVQTFDQQGNKSFESPGVEFREPTPLDAFEAGEALYYRQCLAEAKQLFVLISADSLASGESRIQARQDHLTNILEYKADVDKFGGWLLSTLLHLVASLAGKDGYFKGIGVTFDARVTAGELSADEKNVVISRYEKHLISRENALVLLGTEDPLLEIDAIRADIAEQMADNVRRAAAMSRFSDAIAADKAANQPTNTPPKRVKKGQPPKG